MNLTPQIRLMSHLVAGYPDKTRDFEVARAMIDAGAELIEVQFPYSDPAADGPVIQDACSISIDGGFTVDAGFDLVRNISAYCRAAEPINGHGRAVFVMSYAGLIYARGIDRFLEEIRESGATGIIAPDLAPGYDEGLYDASRRYDIAAVPVVAPSVTSERLESILALQSPYLYAAIRTGITGRKSRIDSAVEGFLRRLRRPGSTLIAGFGVSDYEQAAALHRHADMLVVGTAFVREISEAERVGRSIYAGIFDKVCEITGGIEHIETEEEADRPRDPVGG